MSIIKNEELNWRALFDSLINDSKVTYDLTVEANNINLLIDADLATNLQTKLKEMLESTEGFAHNLPYVVQTSQSQLATVAPLSKIESPVDSVESGKQILTNILGPVAFDAVGLDLDKIFDGSAYTKDRVLFSKVARHKNIVNAWNNALTHWVTYFKNVEIDRIREAWLTGNSLPEPPNNLGEESQDNAGVVNSLIQQCFGTFTNENYTEAHLFFNFGRLWQFISTPEMKLFYITNNKMMLQIDKNHLLACMQVLTKNRVLFRVYQSPENLEEYKARPIFFEREPSVSKRMFHTFIIDQSRSMELSFPSLKVKLNEIIKQLVTLDCNAKIRLVFFSTSLESKEFDIKDLKEINDYITSRYTGGKTNLLNTIENELKDIIKEKKSEHYNSTVILFTDGDDNVATDPIDAFEKIKNTINQFTATSLPKMFAVGYGDYDQEVLHKLGELMGNSYVHLKTIEDFASIFNLIKDHSAQREMIEFFVRVQETTRRYSIPFYHNNSVQVPDVIIPMGKGGPVCVNFAGSELIVTLKDDQVPVATKADYCSELLINAREVISNPVISYDQKITKLQTLLENANKIVVNTEEAGILDHVKNQIEHYHQELIDNQHDARTQASIISLINSDRGFFDRSPTTSPNTGMDAPQSSSSLMPDYF